MSDLPQIPIANEYAVERLGLYYIAQHTAETRYPSEQHTERDILYAAMIAQNFEPDLRLEGETTVLKGSRFVSEHKCNEAQLPLIQKLKDQKIQQQALSREKLATSTAELENAYRKENGCPYFVSRDRAKIFAAHLTTLHNNDLEPTQQAAFRVDDLKGTGAAIVRINTSRGNASAKHIAEAYEAASVPAGSRLQFDADQHYLPARAKRKCKERLADTGKWQEYTRGNSGMVEDVLSLRFTPRIDPVQVTADLASLNLAAERRFSKQQNAEVIFVAGSDDVAKLKTIVESEKLRVAKERKTPSPAAKPAGGGFLDGLLSAIGLGGPRQRGS